MGSFIFQHLSPDEQLSSEGALNGKGSPTPPRKRPSRNKSSYDPFLLVPCRKFLSASAVPFDVLIQSETLVVMDTHAHMSTTEVIGLLGGNYLHESRILKVRNFTKCDTALLLWKLLSSTFLWCCLLCCTRWF